MRSQIHSSQAGMEWLPADQGESFVNPGMQQPQRRFMLMCIREPLDAGSISAHG
jgi:hypothetical protein